MKYISKNKRFITFIVFVLLVITGVTFMLLPHPPSASKDLVLNLPKNEYSVGESILFHITAVNCQSKLKLEISPNKSLISLIFPISPISLSPVATSTCGTPGTAEPDYITRWTPEKPGKYRVILSGAPGRIQTAISISPTSRIPPISLERWTPTRLNSGVARYPMAIKITAGRDISGTVTQTLPAGFKLVWWGTAQASAHDISWKINLKRGESINLSYDFSYSGSAPALIRFPALKITNKTLPDSAWNYIYVK